MTKFKVTVQVTEYRSLTAVAASKELAIEKAAKRLEDKGVTAVAFRAEEIEGAGQ